tara:strand:+ start:1140 stop:2285 length:1146 start_codon:yes stop_codon:yes gene_type:complete
MLPRLDALQKKHVQAGQDISEDDEYETGMVWSQLLSQVVPETLRSTYTAAFDIPKPTFPIRLSKLYNDLFAADEEFAHTKPVTVVATSDLWYRKQQNVNQTINNWKHLEGQRDIIHFFETAGESSAGTLAHVVLTRKKATDRAFVTCVDAQGIDQCQHGHLSLVLEQTYVGKTNDVVSIGFFPETGTVANLLPGYPDRGVVQVPDPMIIGWKQELALIDDDDVEDEASKYMTVLQTFVYAPSKMKQWSDILKSHKSKDDVEPDGFSMWGLEYSMFSGVGPLASLSTLTSTMRRLATNIDQLEQNLKLPIVSKTSGLEPMNCATYVLALAPEANVSCTLGVPLLCEKDPAFDTVENGVGYMLKEAMRLNKIILDISNRDYYG